MRASRPEEEIFQDLEKLCASSGYAHAIAYLCWRDNYIFYAEKITPDDLGRIRSEDSLTRTELSTLIGLMIKGPMDFTLPSPDVTQKYISETERLLGEIHQSMTQEFFNFLQRPNFDRDKDNPFQDAKVLREAIFYGGDSAYAFQYKDFCVDKYTADKRWFVDNKGFAPEDVRNFISGIGGLPKTKFDQLASRFKIENANQITFLPVFNFTKEELASATGQNVELVERIVNAFCISARDPNIPAFKNVSDFNLINAYPFIPVGDGSYLLFQFYSIAEAFYETPFFWMREDKTYLDTAMENRGNFTENFSHKRLKAVFGSHRVYLNVQIVDEKEENIGEIDVLAVYADRAIIVQAKAKKLTVQARKGNDNALKKDFRDGIQKAYEQGFECAECLLDKKYKLISEAGEVLAINRDYAEVFIFCVLSDHYPALAFQADKLLECKEHKIIAPPYVMDIFFLDVMCEFLDAPLQCLNYIHRRLGYSGIVHSTNEITILSFHLAHNLWIDQNEHDMMMLADDIAVHLDSAILVRREGLPGQRTPKGILTKFKDTFFETIINEINAVERSGAIDLGYFLLELNEETIEAISKSASFIIQQTCNDNSLHDFTIAAGNAGLTVHCSFAPDGAAYNALHSHCEKRKYFCKATRWFGLVIDPSGPPMIRIAMGLDYPWKQSDLLDEAVKNLPKESHKTLSKALHKSKMKNNAGKFAQTGLNRKQRRSMRAKERQNKE